MIVSYFLDLPDNPIAFARTQAVSGTHTACVGVMEQLAKNNPSDLFFVCAGPHDTVSPLHPNLYYTSRGIPNETRVLILSTQFGFGSSSPASFPALKKVIYVCHSLFPYDPNIITLHDMKIPIAIVYLCEWTKQHIDLYMHPDIRDILRKEPNESYRIGNPILSDALPPLSRIVGSRRQRNSFLWAATWERGGHMALRVFRKVRAFYPDATFHVASYFPIDQELKADEPGIVLHGALGKRDLYELMSKTETFIYPLVLPSGVVHKDTFGCCVSEAIACGCRVVTYGQGSLRELYSFEKEKDERRWSTVSGLIEFVRLPPDVNEVVSNAEFWSISPWLVSEEAAENMFRAVMMIPGGDARRLQHARHVRELYNDVKIYEHWKRVIRRKVKITYYLNAPFEHGKGRGMSGTHTACKIVMDHLSLFHDTCICTAADEIPVDTKVLILSTQFKFPGDPTRFTHLTRVVYVTHMTYMYPYAYEIPQLINMGIRVSVVFLSEWMISLVRFHLINFHGFCPIKNDRMADEYKAIFSSIQDTFENKVTHHLIGNPLPCLPTMIDRQRPPHSYIYSTTWERGGDFAVKVFRTIRRSFPNATFHIASYHDSIPEKVRDEPGVLVHGSLSKDELMDLLSRTDTMLYPTTVHKDTFSCTISEALACGCRVVSYAQGALECLYEGLVEFVTVPPDVQKNSLDLYYYVEDPWFVEHESEAVEGFAKAVLENHDDEPARKSRALEVRRRFSLESIGQAWMSVIDT